MRHLTLFPLGFLLLGTIAPLSCDDGDPATFCPPGEQQSCTCDDSAFGTRTCATDGSAYGECECDPFDAGQDTETGGDADSDVDADGDADTGAGSETIVDDQFDKPVSLDVADVDGDQQLDILGAAANANEIAWWRNVDGDGTVWQKRVVNSNFQGARSVHAADMDGDGDVDIVGAALFGGNITWWENGNGAGTEWQEHPVVNDDFYGTVSVFAADVDDDGDLDLLSAAFSLGDITWWENVEGDGEEWSEHVVAGDFKGAKWVQGADVDGDGSMDVVGAASESGEITWWENSLGDGSSWVARPVATEFSGAFAAITADVDGDETLDILGAAFEADRLSWWKNPGDDTTPWLEQPITTAFDGASGVFAADLNADGLIDILGAAGIGDEIAWWEQTTDTDAPWQHHLISDTFDGASSILAADIDDDGKLDIIGAAEEADTVMWWSPLSS